MNIKQKAFIQAVGILCVSIFAGVLVSVGISKIPAEAVPYIAIAALLGIALNLIYSLNLNRLEQRETLEKIRKMD